MSLSGLKVILGLPPVMTQNPKNCKSEGDTLSGSKKYSESGFLKNQKSKFPGYLQVPWNFWVVEWSNPVQWFPESFGFRLISVSGLKNARERLPSSFFKTKVLHFFGFSGDIFFKFSKYVSTYTDYSRERIQISSKTSSKVFKLNIQLRNYIKFSKKRVLTGLNLFPLCSTGYSVQAFAALTSMLAGLHAFRGYRRFRDSRSLFGTSGPYYLSRT